MDYVYFLVVKSSAFHDKLDVFKTYFLRDGGFSSAFGTAIVIAAIFCVLYYVLCRLSFKWSTIWTWLATLAVAGIVSFAYTGHQTGVYSNNEGVVKVVEKQYKAKTSGLTPEQQQPYAAEKAKLKNNFRKAGMFSAPIQAMCWTDLVITLIFFWVFSCIINGLSGNGVNIPHRGLIRP